MAKTPEGRIKELVDAVLKSSGAWYFKPVSNGMGVHGIPDYVGIHRGRGFTIETKRPGGCLTMLQERQTKLIEAAGGKWFLCDGDLTEITEWLNESP
jgi:hypothetical protein